jgi:hypothetical protein
MQYSTILFTLLPIFAATAPVAFPNGVLDTVPFLGSKTSSLGGSPPVTGDAGGGELGTAASPFGGTLGSLEAGIPVLGGVSNEDTNQGTGTVPAVGGGASPAAEFAVPSPSASSVPGGAAPDEKFAVPSPSASSVTGGAAPAEEFAVPSPSVSSVSSPAYVAIPTSH